MEMRQEMHQRQCDHLLIRAVVEFARWGFRRNIEPLEGLSLAILLGWATSLSRRGVFDTAPSFEAMARLTAWADAYGWAREWPWAIFLWVIVGHLGAAYALGAWSYWRNGYWEDHDRLVCWSRRIRFGGLALLGMWWTFVAGMVGYANLPGTGWKTYLALGLFTSWSAIRLVWDYGAVVLPFTGETTE